MEPNWEEKKIIDEVKEHIRKRYFKQEPVRFEVFEPLTPEWKSEFRYPSGGYAWVITGLTRLFTRQGAKTEKHSTNLFSTKSID